MPNGRTLTLLHASDIHAYVQEHPEIVWSGPQPHFMTAGGLARMATAIRRIREERPGQTVFLEGGDTYHGTRPAIASRGELLAPLMVAMAPAAAVPHWEWSYGREQVLTLAQRLACPMLGLNAYDTESGRTALLPYRMLEVNGLRLAVLGLTAAGSGRLLPPDEARRTTFTTGLQELPLYVNRLRQQEKADLVVVLSHLGLPQDLQIASQVPGVQVILGGRTHNRMEQALLVKGAIVMQSGSLGSFLGRLDLRVEGGRIADFHHRLIPMLPEIPADPEVQGLATRALAPYQDAMRRAIGHTEVPLHRYAVFDPPMDQLILLAFMEAAACPLAMIAGWRFGAPIPAGPLTLNDLWNMLPTDPELWTVQLTGDELRRHLETSLSDAFPREPFRQRAGLATRILGATLYCRLENPEGHRIQEAFVGPEPLRGDRLYTVAFAPGHLLPEACGTSRRRLGISAVAAVQHFLAKVRTVALLPRGAWVLIA